MTARAIPSLSDLPFNPEDVRPTWCRVVEGTSVRKLGGGIGLLGNGLREVRSVRAGAAHGAFEAVRIAVDLGVDGLRRLERIRRRTQVVAAFLGPPA
jgi:hypothetical protein